MKFLLYIVIVHAVKGKKKLDDSAKKFAEDSKMNAEDGKKFVESMIASAETTKEDFSEKIEETVKKTMSKLGLATQAEVDELKANIAKLEAKIKKG